MFTLFVELPVQILSAIVFCFVFVGEGGGGEDM